MLRLVLYFLMVVHIAVWIWWPAGIVYAWLNNWYRPYHAAFILVIVVHWPICGGCILTIWEDQIRMELGEDAEPDRMKLGFIRFYTRKWLNLSLSAIHMTWYGAVTAGLTVFLLGAWASQRFNL